MKFIAVIGWLFGELEDTSKNVKTIVQCDPQEKLLKFAYAAA